ncbi:MOSC domain-containing protein [Paenibacillus gansuensis]|uniref:MOSC domain-containing protein n=1 Tax=Paenibacillus gansuensis TaxID=306542 RepID=A0ABW5PMC4_9BACL
MKIISLFAGEPRLLETATEEKLRTAIHKSSANSLRITKQGIQGDDVANTKHHGGPDRVVCLYSLEHYASWEAEYGHPMQTPGAGENVLTEGMTEDKVRIGDMFRMGTALLQVTQGRVPCRTLAVYNNMPDLHLRFKETGWTGYFMRILEEGTVTGQSAVELVSTDPAACTVAEANHILFHQKEDAAAARRLFQSPGLAQVWSELLSARLR